MQLTHDFMHPTPHGGRCRVRIYEDTTDQPVIVCTEPDDNPGMSITNAAEMIAAGVIEKHREVLDPFSISGLPGVSYLRPFIWVEHYETGARGTVHDRATFDLVTFSHYEPQQVMRAGQWCKEIGTPTWTLLNRADVEAMLGEKVG